MGLLETQADSRDHIALKMEPLPEHNAGAMRGSAGRLHPHHLAVAQLSCQQRLRWSNVLSSDWQTSLP